MPVEQFQRYAIYYAPRKGSPLANALETWLGTSEDDSRITPLPGYDIVRHSALITSPQRYGTHGTIKPPFFLADGTSYEELRSAVERLATRLAPAPISPASVQSIGPFIALCPDNQDDALSFLAGHCIRDLDAFRAPPSAKELERRRKANLTQTQEEHLIKWGYPYVFDEFRFHVTLTNALQDSDERAHLLEKLQERLAPALAAEALFVQDLCLFGDPGNGGRFTEIERFALQN